MPQREVTGTNRGRSRPGSQSGRSAPSVADDRTKPSVICLGMAMLALALCTAGCGNFWQNPYSSSSSSGSTATTTDLTSSSSSITADASITLTATVSPTAATGTVTFYNNSTSIGSGTLDSGSATLLTSFTSAGTETLTATYSGDSTYASSTSSAVTVTVQAASSSVVPRATAQTGAAGSSGAAQSQTVNTMAYEASPIHATQAFAAKGGTYAAKNAGAAVVEGAGSVALTEATLKGAAGASRGILLKGDSRTGIGAPSFTMTGGSIAYECDAALTPACSEGSKSKQGSGPAALFAIENAKAKISLTDVMVTNNTPTADNDRGTLLTVEAPQTQPAAGADLAFRAAGAALKGDVVVDGDSTAALAFLADGRGTGSSLTGTINHAGTGKVVAIKLDAASLWTVTGTSHLTNLEGLDLSAKTVNNIDGGGHCVYYSGGVNRASDRLVYALSGGGYLAPEGTAGLACE